MHYKKALQLNNAIIALSVLLYAGIIWRVEIVRYVGVCALGVIISMHIFFAIGMWKKNHTVADIAWGLNPVFIAHIAFWMKGEFTVPRVLVLAMVTIWGLRLATHIYNRSRGHDEDERYKFMRESFKKRGHALLNSYLRIYLMQSLWVLIITCPVVLIICSSEKGVVWLYWLGAAVWLFGFLWEVIADYQLKQFLSVEENKGHMMKKGLWNYTQHPNYFGEATLWWGVYIMALNVQGGWLTFFGPFFLTFSLFYVTGVPLVEKMFRNSDEFVGYQKRTSKFLPWFPKE